MLDCSKSCVLLLALALVACGGKGAASGQEKKVDLDADPVALLPASAVIVANVETRAILDGGSAGGELAVLAGRLLPLGAESGFLASRDVDRVVVASYATGGADFAAVIGGRFDEAKIGAMSRAADGSPIVAGVYADRTTYTAGPIEYVVLSSRTVVSGSGDGLRRVLDRIKAGALERSLPPWMLETLGTAGAQVALAADFSTQPIASAALGSVNLAWLKSMRVARVIGNFDPPGMNVAATLTYDDPERAQAAAEGVRVVDGWLKVLGLAFGGVHLQNLQVNTEAKDLRCKFAVDDRTLRTALALAERFIQTSR